MAKPWYRNGLQFTCTRCGHCCTGAPGFVWVTEKEIAALAEQVELTPEQFKIVYTRRVDRQITLKEKANGDCVFYDRQAGCTVYQARPAQCRTWPFWKSRAGTQEAWEATRAICPGAGTGELIPPEEITRRIKVIRL